MNIGNTYVNTCDNQPSTWTITHLEGDMVTVYSPQSDRSYTIDRRIFEDTMRALGFELMEEEPKYILRFLTLTSITSEHDTFDQALRTAEKVGGYAFQIELGDMVCATYSLFKGFKFTEEYKRWYQDQERMLAQREGSYP